MNEVTLDSEISALVELVALPDVNAEVLAGLRDQRLMAPVEPSGLVEWEDVVVPLDPPVTIRIHRPVGLRGPAPCLYSIHGGGYVIGSYELDDLKFDRWCHEFRIVGVSVEYRLAPETPYPGPLDDCYGALGWIYANAAMIGVDPNAIGITGISAGGGLCAGLSLLVRDRAEIPVQFQLLDCPMIDDRQQTPSSQLDNLAIWSKASNQFGWQCYLGDLFGTNDVPGYAAASRATNLAGLPPAYVSVGGADGFRDENIEYALRLNQAGVPTELHVYPGLPHGVGMFPTTRGAKRYANDQKDWLARQFEALR